VLFELFLSKLQQHEFERSILITIGISMILLYGMQYLFSATPRMVDTSYGFAGVDIGSIRITWTRIIAGGVAVGAFAMLYVVLQFTQFGRAMRAIAQNREAALMVGIKPRTVARNAVMLATALCGLAGAAIAPLQVVVPDMGQFLIFKAFALVIIAGLGNMAGTIAVAIGLGLIESWIGGFFEIIWQDSAVFVLMILALLLRPEGLFQRGGMRVG
jgi:branched-chain amino acid transport system permease protein